MNTFWTLQRPHFSKNQVYQNIYLKILWIKENFLFCHNVINMSSVAEASETVYMWESVKLVFSSTKHELQCELLYDVLQMTSPTKPMD